LVDLSEYVGIAAGIGFWKVLHHQAELDIQLYDMPAVHCWSGHAMDPQFFRLQMVIWHRNSASREKSMHSE
jgi:hypothetical protein